MANNLTSEQFSVIILPCRPRAGQLERMCSMAKKPTKGPSESTQRRALKKLRQEYGNMLRATMNFRILELAMKDYREALSALTSNRTSIEIFAVSLQVKLEALNIPKRKIREMERELQGTRDEFLTAETLAEEALLRIMRLVEVMKTLLRPSP